MRSSLPAVLLLATLATGLGAGAARAQLTAEDFKKIASKGFLEVVDGAFPTLDSDTARCSPDSSGPFDCRRNNYPWSMAFFQGQLYVGTARDVFCFFPLAPQLLDYIPPGTCPANGYPTQDQRAEIWRYTPGGSDGLSGTWERIFLSPELGLDQPGDAGELWKCLLLFATEPDPDLREAMTVSCFLNPPANLSQTFMARDTGYRNMTTCTTGTPPQEHLYVVTTGLPGLVLYWNPDSQTFVRASSEGLRVLLSGFTQEPPEDIDIGYRGSVCFLNKVWIAPAASFLTGDTDISDRPVVLFNADPTSTDEPWLQANFPGFDNFIDPNNPNLGIFELATYDPDEDGEPDYLVAGTFNRDQGMEIWWTDGTGCDTDIDDDQVQDCVWTKVLDQGAGRPSSLPEYPQFSAFALGGPTANAAVAAMGQFGPNLYVSLSEAAALVTNTLAEIIRIRPDGSWDLIMGAPRQVPGGGVGAFPGTMNCTPQNVNGVPHCLPLSGRGLGFGNTVGQLGVASYVWRLTKHGAELFGGTLDIRQNNATSGFDLWKTGGGTSWSLVDELGFGNEWSNGVRTLLSSAAGLFLGAANPFTGEVTGGLEVYFANEDTAAPIAEAGPDTTVFDPDGTADLELDGSGSFDPLGGSVVAWEWYDGDVTATCETVTTPFATGEMHTEPRATGATFTDYLFTLRVEDDGGLFDCDTVAYRASMNLPPAVGIWTDPPLVPGPLPRLALVDFDGDGMESFEMEGTCIDPEGSLDTCVWTVDAGVTLTPPAGLMAAVDVLSEAELSGGDPTPDISLTATDTLGFVGAFPFDVRVETLVDNPEVNNAPECASGTTWAKTNEARTIDPTDDQQRFCIDPDNADGELTYEILSQPDNGSVVLGSLVYTPDLDFIGDDVFTYRAADPGPVNSQTVALRIRVVECPGMDLEAILDGLSLGTGGVELYSGCLNLTATNSTVVTAGDVTLEAGQQVMIGNGFGVDAGAQLTVGVDPALLEPTP